MRIAILGGGASGLSAAWSLDLAHDIVLFERADVLGGHIRTLGANVRCDSLPADVRLDAGVVELDRANFPAVHGLLAALRVPAEEPPNAGATCLYRADGRALRSPAARDAEHPHRVDRLPELLRVLPAMLRMRRFLHQAERFDEESLAARPVGGFLDDGDFGTWVRSLLMYAYSMSHDEVSDISASLAVPMLREFLRPNRWTRIPGGMYRYVERIAQTLRGEIRLGARIRSVHRDPDGIRVVHRDGAEERFDALVLAIPPHRVLDLLADPSDLERVVFGSFHGAIATTMVHTDVGPYVRRGAHFFTEFDLFELPSGEHGYNAYLNRLAGLGTDAAPHYSLAFRMEEEIDPKAILHRQEHDVAHYTTESLRNRADLVRNNGARSTYYAGAFLGDGLHEGAIRSGFAVGALLGGRIV